LLSSHESISDFFSLAVIKVSLSKIKFLDVFEVRKNFTNYLGVVETQNLIVDFENSKFWKSFQDLIEIVIMLTENLIDLEFHDLATVFLEILETLEKIFETVKSEMNN
jgi:hypothetical protein